MSEQGGEGLGPEPEDRSELVWADPHDLTAVYDMAERSSEAIGSLALQQKQLVDVLLSLTKRMSLIEAAVIEHTEYLNQLAELVDPGRTEETGT